MDVVNATLVHISQVIRDDIGKAGRIDDQVLVERLCLELPAVGKFQYFYPGPGDRPRSGCYLYGLYTSAGQRCVGPATVT